MRDINMIIVHCSDSPPDRGDDAATIHRWHKERGWDGIGYHYVILEDGSVQSGRPEYWTGAHCKAYNFDSIGICLIGEDSFTLEQRAALRILCTDIIDRYPAIKHAVVGHCDLDGTKTCPNFNVKKWWVKG